MRPAQRNEPQRSDPSTTARVCALLTAFRPGDEALSVSELARRAGLPKTSTHRLVSHMIANGLLERDGAAVRLGLRLFEIGQLAIRQRGLVDSARPHLADLREATRNTVHLAVLEGTEVVYLDVLRGPDAPRLPSRIGGRFPAHATGVGKAILAHAGEQAVEKVLETSLPAVSRRTITSPAILRKQLATIRAEGVAYDLEESGVGVVCAASPVLDGEGAAVAAISISGWSNRMRTERIAPAVRTAALTLSRKLR
ncbi:IclR family transcriptional regulator [Haloechinothrix sp. LS1_15]|uniref:IclR family transcriptional regulator n=1 Tax=Haloechinothrix sp. LS1_15 TaxID=2652248 RepID=UPI002945BCDC|nr:IclR family transcriptional regulator [Haloechinothrix sp. LS1_15]MDV6014123.1 IclR family transcriptional regulator [Haloechinothrix sp. LS1_15]